MVSKKSVKKKLEDGSKTIKDAGEKIEKAKETLDVEPEKVTSPFDQKKQELDAMNKAREPFDIMKAKQQTKATMDTAKEKAEAAKKLLDAKELAHKEGKNRLDKTMSDAKEKADKAKKGIEDAQQEFQRAGELVKSLLAKIENTGKAKVPSSVSGGSK